MSKTKKIYIGLLAICFIAGGYLWKVTRNSFRPTAMVATDAAAERPAGVLVYVGADSITNADLDFEYSLHTSGVFDADGVTPVIDVGAKMAKTLAPLKERLLTSIIERKLLFLNIKQDRSFTVEDPARFTKCLSEWQSTIAGNQDKTLFKGEDATRLKERLCERSLIEQYLQEKVFATIKPTDAEVKDYYDRNRKSFSKPGRIVIRQIVTGTEESAEQAMQGLNKNNFAERAKQLSIAPEAEHGGLVGPFARGELPKFFDYAFGMSKGEIYGVIKSSYGFHVIMLEDRIAKVDMNLAQARTEIVNVLTKEKQDKEYRKWIDIAVNAVPVKTPGSKI